MEKVPEWRRDSIPLTTTSECNHFGRTTYLAEPQVRFQGEVVDFVY
jgi:hypothetical protein